MLQHHLLRGKVSASTSTDNKFQVCFLINGEELLRTGTLVETSEVLPVASNQCTRALTKASMKADSKEEGNLLHINR